MSFQTIHSRTIFQGKAFDVRLDTLRLPNGKETQLDMVVHPGAVVIVPVDAEGQFWFIQQYRQGAGGEILELPAGTLEPDEDPLEGALREVREEIGMAAGKLVKLGEVYMAPGYSTEYVYFYLATELTPAPLPGDDDEFIRVERIPAAQAYALAEAGHIHDSKTLAGLLLARPRL
ncbi:MAG: NUDIX hydrolase [Chloroflexi bacterium]|nr:NUDIX hydrolase [Chloroflexota bacterium]